MRKTVCPLKKKKRDYGNGEFIRADNRKGSTCAICDRVVSKVAGHYRFIDDQLVVLCDEHLKRGSKRG